MIRVEAAIRRMGDEAPQRLFYGAMLPRGSTSSPNEVGRGITDGLDPDAFGTRPQMVAVSFDASSRVHQKFLR